jgi:predicted alpha/beta-fold hydrolase
MRAFLAAMIVSLVALTVAACSSEREVRVAFDDTRMGRVEISGVLHPGRSSKRLLVLVHGLGDDHDAPAVKEAAEVASGLGWATLRMSMRGADKSGQGFYFAGEDDIAQAIASAPLAKYESIAIVGFSLGAHNALRYAAAKPDPRVKAIVAVSAPLDLEKFAASLDASPNIGAVMARVAAQYRPFHDEMMKRGKLQWLPNPDRIKGIRQLDNEVTGPIRGHKDAAAYWAAEAVRLQDIKIPVAMVAGSGDPLVPIALTRALATSNIEVFEVDGGHITMSPSMTMGQRGPDGLMMQALAWIDAKLL